MASKIFQIDRLGEVTVYKRRGNRNIRLSVDMDGKIRISIPSYASYRAGLAFAESKAEWLLAQRVQRQRPKLVDGQTIGKAHRLTFQPKPSLATPKTRVKQNEVVVYHPASLQITDPEVQRAASKACIRALKAQAERLLPQRLQTLAGQHGLSYRSVRVKNLKSRWGSCDQDKNIILNLHLMQLPWELIDYVLLHELTHTKVMRHGTPFWQEMELYIKKPKALRKLMREHQPSLNGTHA